MDPLLANDDNPLQVHYRDFQVDRRILLSGHSHQAWPDVARNGVMKCYDDAARWVDQKWELAFQVADQVRDHLGALLNVAPSQIVLGQSTHDLLLRFLSCLPWTSGCNIVTTDGEFHSMQRQLGRLQEWGINIKVIPASPIQQLSQRLIDAMDEQTIAVMASLVMFQNARVVPQLSRLVQAAEAGVPTVDPSVRRPVACLIDTYHAVNAIPFDAKAQGLESAFLVGGGYKYLQAGEGNCFLTIPPKSSAWSLRPVITGWFAQFAQLEDSPSGVPYGTGHHAFAGSTYDPTSHYRAREVFQFFRQQELVPDRLFEINQQQKRWLLEGLTQCQIPQAILDLSDVQLEGHGGFLAIPSICAPDWVTTLRQHQIYCDSRDGILRLGPAPYVSRSQIFQAIRTMKQVGTTLANPRREMMGPKC